jgi:hypothetical protein
VGAMVLAEILACGKPEIGAVIHPFHTGKVLRKGGRLVSVGCRSGPRSRPGCRRGGRGPSPGRCARRGRDRGDVEGPRLGPGSDRCARQSGGREAVRRCERTDRAMGRIRLDRKKRPPKKNRGYNTLHLSRADPETGSQAGIPRRHENRKRLRTGRVSLPKHRVGSQGREAWHDISNG